MINIYAYTYPGAISKYLEDGYILTKIGDSIRDVDVRMGEQGAAAEYESKIRVGAWNNCQVIQRDHDLHKILTKRGLHIQEGAGTEWFKIPGKSLEDVHAYVDTLVADFEGKKIRNKVTLRTLQQRALDDAMDIIRAKNNRHGATVIANLCPRFGKTIWGLKLFNEVTATKGARVMLLPAYWLSVHSSFIDELELFDDFQDITVVDPNKDDAEYIYQQAIDNGQRVLVPISLHGDVKEWSKKHRWIKRIPHVEKFVFADEGDFGTHGERQVKKLKYITGKPTIRIFASGTNVQRLAKGSGRADGVIYTSYAELENTETTVIKRKFYMTNILGLKEEVEDLDEMIQPNWTKLNNKVNSNKLFFTEMFKAFIGENPMRPELNLSNVTGEPVDCFMILTSATKAGMEQMKQVAERAIPNWHVKILNGDYTSNKKAQYETTKEINEARIAGKEGILIIANQMGSRSYSIPEIQATVITYDRGSVDATAQKVSRSLTPGKKYDGTTKEYGHIIDISFDPNRSENIERLIIDEAVAIERGGVEDTFEKAVKYFMNSVNVMKLNEFGYAEEVLEEDLFEIMGSNENLLRVADITADAQSIVDAGLEEVLAGITSDGKLSAKKEVAGKDAKTSVTRGGEYKERTLTDKEKKDLEKLINAAIRSLNMSATSVHFLAGGGDSYVECIELIDANETTRYEFFDLFGIMPADVISLTENNVLNEAILDVIVQNSKQPVDGAGMLV